MLALVQDHGRKDLAQRFDKGISAWLENGDTLDKCLGLAAKRGQRSARTLYAEQQRNRYLREAWNTLKGPPTPRALKLAEAIQVFESRYWPTWSKRDEPPPGASQLRVALFRARQHGKLPAERQLFELMKASDAASCLSWFSQKLM